MAELAPEGVRAELLQQYRDMSLSAAEKGQMIITDGKSTPLLNVPAKSAEANK